MFLHKEFAKKKKQQQHRKTSENTRKYKTTGCSLTSSSHMFLWITETLSAATVSLLPVCQQTQFSSFTAERAAGRTSGADFIYIYIYMI